ncbi:hypothetical protein GQ44DRAFT_780321 [Phaeosphaeriaceae sp. PMI808]|nr:hypothetical protein GQ44DRAFT_780321 [Phaeosphaeriaceae sp. PMI808]
MQIQAIVLLFAATVSAASCYNRGERFFPTRIELPERNDPNYRFSYCSSANGCCSDRKVWYACQNKCAGGAACNISGNC